MIGTVLTKVALGATSVGTGVVMGNVMKAFKPIGSKAIEKTLYSVGAYAISGAVGVAAVSYVSGQIDEIKNIFKNEELINDEVKEGE